MRYGTLLTLLICIAISGCEKKRSAHEGAGLALFVDGRTDAVGWLEIRGGWAGPQRVMIDAIGYGDERFLLDLHPVAGAGLLSNPKPANIRYTEPGFGTGEVASGFIHIEEHSARRLWGRFDVWVKANGKTIRLRGSFAVYAG